MFPITFAMMEFETIDSWNWFMERLIQDISIVVKHGWVFILNHGIACHH